MLDLAKEVNEFYYHMALYELQVMNGEDYYHGLSYNSILYLNIISQMQECTVSKLAEALGITKSAVTIKVNELVRQGVVRRTQSTQDRRVNYLNLSNEVAQTVSIYDRVFEQIEGDLLQQYSQQELNLFCKILHDISSREWRRMEHE